MIEAARGSIRHLAHQRAAIFFNDEHARPPRRSSRSHKNAVEPGIWPLRLFFETSLKKIKMSSTAQKRKLGKVMHEHKDGNLKNGSGRMVKSRKQAVSPRLLARLDRRRRQEWSPPYGLSPTAYHVPVLLPRGGASAADKH